MAMAGERPWLWMMKWREPFRKNFPDVSGNSNASALHVSVLDCASPLALSIERGCWDLPRITAVPYQRLHSANSGLSIPRTADCFTTSISPNGSIGAGEHTRPACAGGRLVRRKRLPFKHIRRFTPLAHASVRREARRTAPGAGALPNSARRCDRKRPETAALHDAARSSTRRSETIAFGRARVGG